MHGISENILLLNPEPEVCLGPGKFIDCSHPDIVSFAHSATEGIDKPIAKAVALYGKVRDGVRYSPYRPYTTLKTYLASTCLIDGSGCCVEKAALLAACARVEGIPARLGFANIRNHLSSARLLDYLETDMFYWHGYTELWLNERWVKATPTFDLGLCEKFGVLPLEFDGCNDSVFHPYDAKGQKHMEYLTERGSFSDVPADTIMEELKKIYPKLIVAIEGVVDDFHQEARPLTS